MVGLDIKDFPDLDNELDFVQELVREQVIKFKFTLILIIFKNLILVGVLLAWKMLFHRQLYTNRFDGNGI